jgi:hypothetical protein
MIINSKHLFYNNSLDIKFRPYPQQRLKRLLLGKNIRALLSNRRRGLLMDSILYLFHPCFEGRSRVFRHLGERHIHLQGVIASVLFQVDYYIDLFGEGDCLGWGCGKVDYKCKSIVGFG